MIQNSVGIDGVVFPCYTHPMKYNECITYSRRLVNLLVNGLSVLTCIVEGVIGKS